MEKVNLPAPERAALREKMLRLAHHVDEQYGDVAVLPGKRAGEMIEPILFSMEHLSVGDVIPDMQAERVDGTKDNIKSYRGKVVLLEYWATWCVRCVKSLRERVLPLK